MPANKAPEGARNSPDGTYLFCEIHSDLNPRFISRLARSTFLSKTRFALPPERGVSGTPSFRLEFLETCCLFICRSFPTIPDERDEPFKITASCYRLSMLTAG